MYKGKAELKNIESIIGYLENDLKDHGYSNEKVIKNSLLCEEIIYNLINNSKEDCDLTLDVKHKKKKAIIVVKCKGQEFNLSETLSLNSIGGLSDEDVDDEEQTSVISNLILKSYSDKFTLKNVRGLNVVEVKLEKDNVKDNKTIVCLVLGLLCGVIVSGVFKDSVIATSLSTVSSFVSNAYIRLIQSIIAPLVFFSIAESVSGFSNFKVFGRVGAKTLMMYCVTTVCAVILSYACSFILKPGGAEFLPYIQKMTTSLANEVVSNSSTSLLDTILYMIPDNFLSPFINSDLLQAIVLAVLLGIASTMLGEYSDSVKNFLKAACSLFSQIMAIISKLAPYSIFCFMFNLSTGIDFMIAGKVICLLLSTTIAFGTMLVVYSILLFFVGNLNPIKFFKNYAEAMFMAITTCSSSMTIPTSMKCLERSGVPKKIYSFSIPLGATINMDGASITFIMLTLAVARIYGYDLSAAQLVSFGLFVILLSMATPCTAGGGAGLYILCLTYLNLPVEAVGFLIPIGTILEFFNTMVNVTGDGVVSTIVAKSENMLKQN